MRQTEQLMLLCLSGKIFTPFCQWGHIMYVDSTNIVPSPADQCRIIDRIIEHAREV